MRKQGDRPSSKVRESNWFNFQFLPDSVSLSPNDRNESSSVAEPFDDFVEVDKNSAVYTAHSYPTKVPPEAIEQFIEHYTSPGERVLDPFCGSGMTGVAACRTGRHAILSDLSPLAVHLAYNHTTKCDPRDLAHSWETISNKLGSEINRLYGIDCDNCHSRATIRYTIWSDIYACPACKTEVNYWATNVDRDTGTVASGLTCASCGHEWKRSAETRTRVEPTWVAYNCGCSRGLRRRSLRQQEKRAAKAFDPDTTGCWFPTRSIESHREMYKRCALHLRSIDTVADFYTPRNLSALSLLWQTISEVENARVRSALAFAFTNTAWHGTKMRRYNAHGGHRPLTGTLYIPQLSSEANVFDVFGNKVSQLARFYREFNQEVAPESATTIRASSATGLDWIPDDSVDYVFTDPPFGSNIFYADCNLIAESWLGEWTNPDPEAVINRSQDVADGGKTLEDYKALLTASFSELYRVLKPGRWATIAFQSSDGEVWSAIQEAASAAGFAFANANGIDKGQKSMKGYKGRSGAENVASFDILLNLRKDQTVSVSRGEVLPESELREFVVKRVEAHLGKTASDESSQRTLPFLYSYTVRQLLNERHSVAGFSMEDLRSYLEARFVEHEGRWYLTPEHRPTAASVG